ncbi:hypothetical protein NEHOM01_0143 [Nematocida homosporus]|uniref:uncharacterized protein n=1 Tax=Nematocida homosporus TaxID=1912981 RepID=UPI00221F06FA|nr:uncharacterized protein NEHOM01_0143 [Nematocida homosporus]KAI5184398.1 hypothetical protein NEHOM01_0143 [Nematocida homosporus]
MEELKESVSDLKKAIILLTKIAYTALPKHMPALTPLISAPTVPNHMLTSPNSTPVSLEEQLKAIVITAQKSANSESNLVAQKVSELLAQLPNTTNNTTQIPTQTNVDGDGQTAVLTKKQQKKARQKAAKALMKSESYSNTNPANTNDKPPTHHSKYQSTPSNPNCVNSHKSIPNPIPFHPTPASINSAPTPTTPPKRTRRYPDYSKLTVKQLEEMLWGEDSGNTRYYQRLFVFARIKNVCTEVNILTLNRLWAKWCGIPRSDLVLLHAIDKNIWQMCVTRKHAEKLSTLKQLYEKNVKIEVEIEVYDPLSHPRRGVKGRERVLAAMQQAAHDLVKYGHAMYTRAIDLAKRICCAKSPVEFYGSIILEDRELYYDLLAKEKENVAADDSATPSKSTS